MGYAKSTMNTGFFPDTPWSPDAMAIKITHRKQPNRLFCETHGPEETQLRFCWYFWCKEFEGTI